MIQIFKGRNIYDLHDLHDLCDLAHVARREPYNLHDLLKHMFTKFELNYTDPAKGITTVVQDLDDVDDVDDVDGLDDDLADMCMVYFHTIYKLASCKLQILDI